MVTAAQVKELREKTGAGMMERKKEESLKQQRNQIELQQKV